MISTPPDEEGRGSQKGKFLPTSFKDGPLMFFPISRTGMF